MGGNLACIKSSLRLGGRLLSTRGQWGKTSASLGSLAIITQLCFLMMCVMESRLGSQVTFLPHHSLQSFWARDG